MKTLVLVGPHGAGKSTMGRRLAQVLGWRFDDEIGYALRQRVRQRDPRAYAEGEQRDFDRQVMAMEWERDRLWRAERGRGRVIETWHPGNLAYAEARSPEVFRRVAKTMGSWVKVQGEVVVVPLTLSLATLEQRQHEEGDAAFFWRVGQRAAELAREMGLSLLAPVATDAAGVEACVAQVLVGLARRRWCGEWGARPSLGRCW